MSLAWGDDPAAEFMVTAFEWEAGEHDGAQGAVDEDEEGFHWVRRYSAALAGRTRPVILHRSQFSVKRYRRA